MRIGRGPLQSRRKMVYHWKLHQPNEAYDHDWEKEITSHANNVSVFVLCKAILPRSVRAREMMMNTKAGTHTLKMTIVDPGGSVSKF